MEKIVQTAGRNALGTFAPALAHYNDDVLFGENWNDDAIDVKTRSIITVVALMANSTCALVSMWEGLAVLGSEIAPSCGMRTPLFKVRVLGYICKTSRIFSGTILQLKLNFKSRAFFQKNFPGGCIRENQSTTGTFRPNSSGRKRGQTFSVMQMTDAARRLPISQESASPLP